MSLEIRKSSNWWYGVFVVNGRKTIINLGVPITGKRPPKRTMIGDDEFERSRGRAMEAYAKQRRKMEEDRTGAKALQKLAEMKTGREVRFPTLAELPELWAQIPRRKAPDPVYANHCQQRLRQFAEFAVQTQPGAKEFVEVKAETARAFMASEEARGLSPKTWNDTLKLLRATFKHLHPHLSDGANPFHGLVTKATETINREPFTVEEMKAILEVCARDNFIRPVIVAGMCTAMRRGDCCLLKWKDVDLKEGFIRVKTAKTGETVEIPVFPLLREELERLHAAKGKSPFCFPEAARMYESNPDGITWRVKQVLARTMERTTANNAGLLLQVSPEEVQAKAMAYIDGLGDTAKADKVRQVVNAYMAGKDIDGVVAQTRSSRGAVSNYLNEVERHTGCPIIRGRRRKANAEALRATRANGSRNASVRDFHSFRVTWITLALAAGVPLELVQRVTGHRTVEVVMKHYFRPGREDFRQALNAAMPELLTNWRAGDGDSAAARQSHGEEIRALVEGMTSKTWKRARATLLKLLDGLKDRKAFTS
jgi:integrase